MGETGKPVSIRLASVKQGNLQGRPFPKKEIKEAVLHWCGLSYCDGALRRFLFLPPILSYSYSYSFSPFPSPNMSLIENVQLSPFITKFPRSESVVEDISLKRGFSDGEYFTLTTTSLHL